MRSSWWVAFWWPQEQNIIPWVEFISQYTPQIYVRNTQSMLFEIGRSHHLIDLKCLKSEIPKAMDGLTLPQIGDSCSPTEALAKARFQIAEKVNFPLEALAYFLDPFREDLQTEKRLLRLISDLKNLGLRSLGSFLSFSEKEVGMRWSHWGKRLWLSVHGYLHWEEPNIKRTELFEETHEFPEEAPVSNLEPLYFICKQLLQKLHDRLNHVNLGARSLKVVLGGTTNERDFEGFVEFQLRLPAFHNETSVWLNLLREHLQLLARYQDLPERLESVTLRVEEVLSWHGLQKDLFDPHREHREGTLLECLTKLETSLGKDKVFCAQLIESYRPEKSWRRQDAGDWFRLIEKTGVKKESPEFRKNTLAKRPLRVFREPFLVALKNEKIFLDGQWKHHRLIWNEIVCGDFWDEPFHRSYGIAYLDHGEKLWLFKENEQVYVQGVFI